MHTQLSDKYEHTREGDRAKALIAKCVHCGFCNATCPTYQLLGDELDGPRGRIYQIKQVFEGATPDNQLALHLDRCLTCRSCETTCPSGVEYHHLLDLGRQVTEQQISRPLTQTIPRWLLKHVLCHRHLMTGLIRIAQLFRTWMPKPLKNSVPEKQILGALPTAIHGRKVLLTQGCVQPGMKPLSNMATARVLDRLGISVVTEKQEGCCAALAFHLNDQLRAKRQMKNNIDAWWPYVENGIEAIVSTASGCGVMIKDYRDVLSDDPAYAEKAKIISKLTKDLSQVLIKEDLKPLKLTQTTSVVFQSPCTLQHGQQLSGVVESILSQCGIRLIPIPDAHICCGSAGTYSIFQKKISEQLRQQKLNAIQSSHAKVIATANIGCQLHLESASELPVVHWIELLDRQAVS